jgi:membrane protein DedA with SNARE-associated domain/pimeloyl-ACP methyl ester carboxylesterase
MARERMPARLAHAAAAHPWVTCWLLLVIASNLWIETRPARRAATSPPDSQVRIVPRAGDDRASSSLELAVRIHDAQGGADPLALPFVLLHGSPGGRGDFDRLAAALTARARVIAPDLPGFGLSERDVADLSARSQANAVVAMLDALALSRCHLVGFSLGGAVAIETAGLVPDRVASLTLLASLGVVELELLGDARLNRAVHFAQYAAIVTARRLVPHFGALDRLPFDLGYAKSFLDTDQTNLRPILASLAMPVSIVHGREDFLVPFAAAQEHERIVPQARLIPLDASHFLPWTASARVAAELLSFADDVEHGRAPKRVDATAERLAAAEPPFDPRRFQQEPSLALDVVFALLLALSTLVSEDLACVGGGLLIAAGRASATGAILGCLLGIFVGDLLLFLLGRACGRPLLASSLRRRFVSDAALDRATDLLRRHGPLAVVVSRFTPGLRLPTYVAAGALGMSLPSFAGWFLLAATLWTPLLVLGSAQVGDAFLELGSGSWLAILAAAFALLVLVRLAVALATRRGRRRLAGRFARARHFEFWPPYAFYPPVVLRLLLLTLRHRGFSAVTAVNPGIETGGFVGESKHAILEGLRGAGDAVARYERIDAAGSRQERLERLARFRRAHGLDLPLVLKPDVGQRGSGVRVLRDEEALERFVGDELAIDHLVQAYVPGVEYGIFWIREPGAERGRIFSVTRKRMPEVVGDGVRSLEQLILDDPRAFAIADTYFRTLESRLSEIPAAGERVQLVELGTHCRGAIFEDGRDVVTPELEEWIERVARSFEGFHFGRFDVRGPSDEHFARAEGLAVIELNGVTSEATHVYDRRVSLREAYSVLFRQWELAFAIGAHNAKHGARTTSLLELFTRFRAYRRDQKRFH